MSVAITATSASGVSTAGTVTAAGPSSAAARAVATAEAAATVQSASQTASKTGSGKSADAVSGDSAAISSNIAPAAVFTKYKGQFLSLTSVVLNIGTKYDLEAQFRAYMGLQDMSLSGKLRGMDPGNERLWMETHRSSIGLMKDYLQQMVASAVESTGNSGAAAAAQAELRKFEAMSALEQKVYFNAVVNTPDAYGRTPYTDAAEYQKTLAEQANGSSSTDSVGTSSGTSASSATASTSTTWADESATASDAASTTSTAVSSTGTVDKVDLSPAAKRIVGQDAVLQSASVAASPWDAGNNISVTT